MSKQLKGQQMKEETGFRLRVGDFCANGAEVLAVMMEQGRPLSELSKVMTALPQVLVNVKVRERIPVESLPGVSAAISAVAAQAPG